MSDTKVEKVEEKKTEAKPVKAEAKKTDGSEDRTAIPLSKGVRDRLKGMKQKGENYDGLFTRLMDEFENARK